MTVLSSGMVTNVCMDKILTRQTPELHKLLNSWLMLSPDIHNSQRGNLVHVEIYKNWKLFLT